MADLDWIALMKQHGRTTPEVFDGRLSTVWIENECELAKAIALEESPYAKYRYERGELSDVILGYVVCQMVLRVARHTLYKQESSGTYSFQLNSAAPAAGGSDMSPNLWLSSGERRLLEGGGDGEAVGTIHMVPEM